MSLATRLDKLLSFLLVRRRLLLLLRAQAMGEEPDPEPYWLVTAEGREYDRFVALIIAANHDLGALLFGLQVIAADLNSRWQDVELPRSAAKLATEKQGGAFQKGPPRDWRRLKAITVPEFLLGVAEDTRAELQRPVDFRWQELQPSEAMQGDMSTRVEQAFAYLGLRETRP